MIRRVVGDSMLPSFAPGRIIIAVRTRRFRPGHVVIARHDGLEKIKRVHSVRDDQVFLLGDNPTQSTDGRDFGWLPASSVVARVLWPARRS